MPAAGENTTAEDHVSEDRRAISVFLRMFFHIQASWANCTGIALASYCHSFITVQAKYHVQDRWDTGRFTESGLGSLFKVATKATSRCLRLLQISTKMYS